MQVPDFHEEEALGIDAASEFRPTMSATLKRGKSTVTPTNRIEGGKDAEMSVTRSNPKKSSNVLSKEASVEKSEEKKLKRSDQDRRRVPLPNLQVNHKAINRRIRMIRMIR